MHYTALLWPVLEWCPGCYGAWTLLLLTSAVASSALWPQILSLIAGMCAVVFVFCVPQAPHKCLAKQVLS